MPTTEPPSQSVSHHAVQQPSRTNHDPSKSVPSSLPLEGTCIPSFPQGFTEEPLSAEDKMILYISLQDIAQELRRIRRERKKNQQGK